MTKKQRDGLGNLTAAEYLDRHWVALAASAWAGYQKHGRGAILLNEGVGGLIEGLTYIEPRVVSAIAEKAKHVTMVEDVATYDPERELVFISITPTGFDYYCGDGEGGDDEAAPRPPQAFEIAKRRGILRRG